MDLVTLFIVNQIAAKKNNRADPPKVAVLGSSKGGLKQKRSGPLVLPMSPCSPSQLSFVESQPLCSEQDTRRRKHIIPQGFKWRQLSPVLESAFSDNSASDYLPSIADPVSPFSSTSPAPSGQGGVANILWHALSSFKLEDVNYSFIVSSGMFPLQLNFQQISQTQLHPQCFPPLWDAGSAQTMFQPFSQPRDMTDGTSWSCGSNLILQPPETSTATGALFGSPAPDPHVLGDHARHEETFFFNQPEDREDNQIEADHQTEDDVFRGLTDEECEREALNFGRRKLKIYLNDERAVRPSTPQAVPDSLCVGMKLSNCSDVNFSCLEPNNCPLNCCDYSPSHSSRTGYLSSDSSNDEDHSQASVHACCADVLSPNLGSQGNSQQRQTQPSPLSPPLKHTMSIRDDHRVMENTVFPYNDIRNNSQQDRSHSDMQRSEPCKCQRTSSQSQDVGTQTADTPPTQMCDASTQCCFVGDGATEATGFNLFPPPTDVLVQYPSTGRQTDTAARINRTKFTTRNGSVQNSSFVCKVPNNTDGIDPTDPLTRL
ncbi:uncharacterized protein [Antennarius striatus]|uniref:uncharacterized protein n=1 Tax=Antennarius striatus TaxID=241820 RepID=UPI0035AF7655